MNDWTPDNEPDPRRRSHLIALDDLLDRVGSLPKLVEMLADVCARRAMGQETDESAAAWTAWEMALRGVLAYLRAGESETDFDCSNWL